MPALRPDAAYEVQQTPAHFGVEFGTFDLIDDGSVVGFVHGKDISALGAFEFSHSLMLLMIDGYKVNSKTRNHSYRFIKTW